MRLFDGVQLLEAVDGYRVTLARDPGLDGRTLIQGSRSRFGARAKPPSK